MPIKIDFSAMLEKRNMDISDLACLTNLPAENFQMLMNGNSEGIRFSTLDGICAALQCEPGDIMKTISAEEYFSMCGKTRHRTKDEIFNKHEKSSESALFKKVRSFVGGFVRK